MELIKPPLPTKIEKHLIAKQALSYEFVTYMQDLFKSIINKPDIVKYQFQKIAKYRAIRVKESDLFEKVADKYRWPVELEKGQPSLEVINFTTFYQIQGEIELPQLTFMLKLK